jgi:hypothetical protein
MSIDPQFPARVLKSSVPLRPGGAASSSGAHEIPIVDSGTLMLIMMTATSTMIFIGIGCYFGRRLALRQKIDVERNSCNDNKLIDDGESETYQGLSPEERQMKEDDKRLREYIVPLLLSQAFVRSFVSAWTSF